MIKLKSLINEIITENIPSILYHGTFNQLAIDIEQNGIIYTNEK
jgi:RNA:NAD 2'-phosphotransferase (TPT1/KptA family)